MAYIKAFNKDGCEVALVGNGVLISEDGLATYTDGSINKGQISFSPEIQNGLKSIAGVSGDNKLTAIGLDAEEGSTLVYTGEFWTVKLLNSLKNSFQSASMKGANRLAGLTCSASGIVELGVLNVTPLTYLYINEDGLYEPKTVLQLTENLLTGLCAAIPIKTAEEVMATTFGCTADGKVIKGATSSNAAYVAIPQLVYAQNKNNGVIGPSNGIVSLPPGAPASAGVFTNNFVDLDLTTISGYTDKAHSAVMMLRAGIVNGALGGSWDLVGVIQGVEYIRVSCAQAGDSRKTHNEVKIKIPDSKIIRMEGIRQVYSGGPSANENSGLEMLFKCFEF